MTNTPTCLPIHMVLALANAACSRYGFKKLCSMELKKMYARNSEAPAIIRKNGDSLLWVDRWYVAIQLDRGDLRYLYMTNHHINEEVLSYSLLKKARKDPPTLPEDIKAQFKTARRWMLPTQQKLYLSKAAEELDLGWVNAWREHTRKELEKLSIHTDERSA